MDDIKRRFFVGIIWLGILTCINYRNALYDIKEKLDTRLHAKQTSLVTVGEKIGELKSQRDKEGIIEHTNVVKNEARGKSRKDSKSRKIPMGQKHKNTKQKKKKISKSKTTGGSNILEVKSHLKTNYTPSRQYPSTYHFPENLNVFSIHNYSVHDLVDAILSRVTSDLEADSVAPRCGGTEQQSFVYIKNHKCASDTLSGVFRRFGYTRNLSFVQPVGNRFNIGWPAYLAPYMYRAPKHGGDGRFHILTEHTVYHENISAIMKPGARYLTSVRHPWAHLKSTFYFFNMPGVTGINHVTARSDDLIVTFLNDMDYWDAKYQDPTSKKVRPCVPVGMSVVRNMMAMDLGFPTTYQPVYSPSRATQEHNVTHMVTWLQQLSRQFDVVLVVEHLHESLVLLKRTLCWSPRDLLYRRANVRKRKRVEANYTSAQVDRYLLWTLPDTLLYTHFNRTLWARIDAMGREDFLAEVDDFNKVLTSSLEFCNNVVNATRSAPDPAPLWFPATRWNAAWHLTALDCRLVLSKSGLRQGLRDRYDANPAPVQQPTPPPGHKIPGC